MADKKNHVCSGLVKNQNYRQNKKDKIHCRQSIHSLDILSDSTLEEWDHQKSRMNMSTHDEFAKWLLERQVQYHFRFGKFILILTNQAYELYLPCMSNKISYLKTNIDFKTEKLWFKEICVIQIFSCYRTIRNQMPPINVPLKFKSTF